MIHFLLRPCPSTAWLVLIGMSVGLGAYCDRVLSNEDFFEADVAPILVMHCLECHQEKNASGGLSLATGHQLLTGGDSGAVIVPKDPGASYFLSRIHDGEMPPVKQGQPQRLDPADLAILTQWIEQGAPWPEGRRLELYERTSKVRAGRDWWSLAPLSRPAVPTLNEPSASQNPIDALIREELDQHQMVPAQRSDKAQLLRRVYYDVLGLPPTHQQVEQFLADSAEDAWEKVVDQLLQSPHYGERWARHWLDVVRFAETSGYERDQEKNYAWKYRDWVIRAFNEDMPYNQFIIEQLAGDEIPQRDAESVTGTGLLRLGTWNDEPNDPDDYVYDRLEDLVHVTSTAFLGMTVKCARCHDHKFDPIYQEDYYRMAGAFWPGPIAARDRELLGGPSAAELGFADILGWTDITKSPSPLRLLRNGEREQPMQEVRPGSLSMVGDLYREFTAPNEEASTTQNRLQLAEWIVDPRNPLTPRVIVNRLWLHHFGAGLVRTPDNFGFTGERPTHPKLLDWLAAELIDNGWRLKPLHKLILMSDTYCQSSLHERASEYEQVDANNRYWWRAERRRLDAESLRDSLLAASGELDLRREGPSFRPTISAEALEGLSQKSAAWNASSENEQRRRSIYMFSKRGLLSPMMTAFDLCDVTQPCGQRDVTTVAPQALVMLNNEFIHQRGYYLARQAKLQGTEPATQLRWIWNAVFARPVSTDELALAEQYLHDQMPRMRKPTSHFTPTDLHLDQATNPKVDPEELAAEMCLASLCVALFNSNEFVYVD